jgi:hypothetical protein
MLILWLTHLNLSGHVYYMTPTKARTLKLQAIKYCIVDAKLHWKDPLGLLLNFLTESETKGVIDEFHKGICGGHHP